MLRPMSSSSQLRAIFTGMVLLMGLPLLSGCAVGMAMSGEEDPNESVLQIGSSQLDVERELGAPHSSKLLRDGGVEAVYQYELGNEPSAGRAVLHGGLDVLTLGLWEVIGTPVEATQGTKYEVTILYDPERTVQSVSTVELEDELVENSDEESDSTP